MNSIDWLNSPAVAGVSATALGGWLRAHVVAAQAGCGDTLRGAMKWTPRQWLLTAKLDQRSLKIAIAEGLLIRIDDDLKILGYDSEGESLYKAKSDGGKEGAKRRWNKGKALEKDRQSDHNSPINDLDGSVNTPSPAHPSPAFPTAASTPQSMNNPAEPSSFSPSQADDGGKSKNGHSLIFFESKIYRELEKHFAMVGASSTAETVGQWESLVKSWGLSCVTWALSQTKHETDRSANKIKDSIMGENQRCRDMLKNGTGFKDLTDRIVVEVDRLRMKSDGHAIMAAKRLLGLDGWTEAEMNAASTTKPIIYQAFLEKAKSMPNGDYTSPANPIPRASKVGSR